MMPIWFLAWIIPLCVFAGFVLFGLMWADDEDALRARLYERQYRELASFTAARFGDGYTPLGNLTTAHENERKAAFE